MSDILDEAYSIVQCKNVPGISPSLFPMKFYDRRYSQADGEYPRIQLPGKEQPEVDQLISRWPIRRSNPWSRAARFSSNVCARARN
jgi:hypothetical protein